MSRHHLIASLAVGMVIGATAAAPAQANTGREAVAARGTIVVFATELQKAKVYTNPDGCQRLPLGAHVIVNLTDKAAKLYVDPLCKLPAVPLMLVKPGYGSHVSAVGAFKTAS